PFDDEPGERGWNWAWTLRSRLNSTRVYTWVVAIEAWPSISCTTRRSAPPASRCVAKLCRRVGGLTAPGRPACRADRLTIDQSAVRDSGRPDLETNTVVVRGLRATSAGRSRRR